MKTLQTRQPLRALTLWRPWPWAILHGGKRVENRPWAPWPSILGQWIALHAGKRWDDEGLVFIRRLAPGCPGSSAEHPEGIVGLARVTGCVRWSNDPWFFGPCGWTLEDVVALPEPVPCRGAQGLWTVEGEALERVRAGWRAAREAVPC